jgi:hypothetical protein
VTRLQDILKSLWSSNDFSFFAGQGSCICAFNFGFLSPTTSIFKKSVYKEQSLRIWLWKGSHYVKDLSFCIILVWYVLKFVSVTYLLHPKLYNLKVQIFGWKKRIINSGFQITLNLELLLYLFHVLSRLIVSIGMSIRPDHTTSGLIQRSVKDGILFAHCSETGNFNFAVTFNLSCSFPLNMLYGP